MSMIHEITTGAPPVQGQEAQRTRRVFSGHGKTSGRGNKGSKARNGKYIKPGYEGGQTAIFRRLSEARLQQRKLSNAVSTSSTCRTSASSPTGRPSTPPSLIEAGLVPDD